MQAADVWPLVLDFIQTYVGEDELKAFKKHFDIEVEHKDDALVKAGGIPALIGSYFKQNKKVYKQFSKAKKAKMAPAAADESESEKGEEELKFLAGKKRKRTDS